MIVALNLATALALSLSSPLPSEARQDSSESSDLPHVENRDPTEQPIAASTTFHQNLTREAYERLEQQTICERRAFDLVPGAHGIVVLSLWVDGRGQFRETKVVKSNVEELAKLPECYLETLTAAPLTIEFPADFELEVQARLGEHPPDGAMKKLENRWLQLEIRKELKPEHDTRRWVDRSGHPIMADKLPPPATLRRSIHHAKARKYQKVAGWDDTRKELGVYRNYVPGSFMTGVGIWTAVCGAGLFTWGVTDKNRELWIAGVSVSGLGITSIVIGRLLTKRYKKSIFSKIDTKFARHPRIQSVGLKPIPRGGFLGTRWVF